MFNLVVFKFANMSKLSCTGIVVYIIKKNIKINKFELCKCCIE